MEWIIAIISIFILLIIAEEVIYYYLRSRIIKNPPKTKRNQGKIKSLASKVKSGRDSPSI
ncbi:hypothetical protein FGG79_02075 [Bacillus sp. BHET2]|uniref:hypothetical protein n=1 Tax=Bacillus sp. BHET2 TaxID=2583818 RepID=UPI00110F05F7|nr:hypothetical protein [Bacillus sp. BHET2]TMU86952.1 hypothetical protein FGG79_02075 [Bacillus sp. BHET2]